MFSVHLIDVIRLITKQTRLTRRESKQIDFFPGNQNYLTSVHLNDIFRNTHQALLARIKNSDRIDGWNENLIEERHLPTATVH